MVRNPFLKRSMDRDMIHSVWMRVSLKNFFDALSAARAIDRFASGKTFDDYAEDDLLASAVPNENSRLLGEAFKPH